MGMGMSVSPQIWQQFVDLVFQDDLIKCKQNFDVIMDDMFIHLTAKEHMDDLIDKLEPFVEWLISYHHFYLTSADYLYQYMTYKRKPKHLNGQKKLKKLVTKLKSY